MIREALELLRDKEWLIDDMDINIAKGLNELPLSFKEIKTIIKRKKLTNGR
tara:strand:+ start:3496 stop:3648 length:153 start_codon:yes stop_codon:yes gene_type:complete